MLIDAELRDEVDRQEEQVEQDDEIYRVSVWGFLRLVHYLLIALDLDLVASAEIIVQYPDQFLSLNILGYLESTLPLVIDIGSACTLD